MLLPYLVLGLSHDAGESEIRQRYLILVKKYPATAYPERYERITKAYEAIKDDRARVKNRIFATLNGDLGISINELLEAKFSKPPLLTLAGIFEKLKG